MCSANLTEVFLHAVEVSECRDSLEVLFPVVSRPPAPMNNVKYLRAGPAEMPFGTRQYKSFQIN